MQLKRESIDISNAPRAVSLADACFQSEHDRAYFRDTYRRMGTGETAYIDPEIGVALKLLDYYIFSDGTRDVATAGLYQRGENSERLWIGWFGVAPDMRRCGVGSAVLESLTEVARNLGAKELALYTTENDDVQGVLSFYRKHGFETLGEPGQFGGSNIFRMVKSLER